MSEFQRQCPVCGGGDQHKATCSLNGKPHVYQSPSMVDWPRTLRENGMRGDVVVAVRDGELRSFLMGGDD